VWLIVVVVLLFVCFPPAFAAFGTVLHIPLSLMLVGIVLRGSAFVFRQYGEADTEGAARWGRVFAIASTVSPVLLGILVGTLTSGQFPLEDGLPSGAFLWVWIAPFPFLVGLFALALFAFLAAVYLAAEASDPALADDFRKRALAAALAMSALAIAAAVAAGPSAAPFAHRLVRSWWSPPLLGGTALAAAGAVGALVRRRYRAARVLAVIVVAAIVGGWGIARAPTLLAPDLTVQSAAAPHATLRLLVPTLGIGAVVLIPCLYWLFKVFKARA
jgi:cytochrome d ubiquinol oxidase subunit II